MASSAAARSADEHMRRHTTEMAAAPKRARAWEGLTLAQHYMLASLLVLVVSMAGLGWWLGREIEMGVIQRTAATTAVYLESFVAPHLQTLDQSPMLTPEQVETLDRLLSETQLGRQVISFKVWGPDGRVIFSPLPSVMGRSYPVTDELARAWQGERSSEISNLEGEANAVERQHTSRLLVTYSPIYAAGSERVIAVAEFFQQVDELQREVVDAQRRSWLIVGLAAVIMYLLLAGIVKRGSDTIGRQRRELEDKVSLLTHLLTSNEALSERVRLAASRTTALNERFLRRISAELHDGPAQDLSYALLRLDSVGADCAAGHEDLAKIQMSLDRAIHQVRAISAGLRLPELDRLTLAETIERVVKLHERRTETRVELRCGELPAQVPLPLKITTYRVIEEALNNAYRHGGGLGQRVSMHATADHLHLRLADRGPGFGGPSPVTGEQHLGLVGMRERVESLGGLFRIDSSPGHGTTISARLPCHVAVAPERSEWPWEQEGVASDDSH